MISDYGASRWRITAGEPLQWGREIKLGELNEDFTSLEIIRCTAPIHLIKAVDEDADLLEDSKQTLKKPSADERT